VIRAAPLTRRCDAGFKPPEEWAGFWYEWYDFDKQRKSPDEGRPGRG